MNILISGGSGFIGTALTRSLLADGHQVWILTRNTQRAVVDVGVKYVSWEDLAEPGQPDLLAQMDAVVNLAGENIGARPWTRGRKERILASRLEAGKLLVEAIRKTGRRPEVFIQASAVGFYGLHPAGPVTEVSPAGSDYLAEVCKAWETSTLPVEEMGVRRVVIRTGVVLAKDEGPLPRMLLPFRLFVGGPLGNGKQGFPWIHPADEVAAIRFLIENEKAVGVFNLCSPYPLSNAVFGRMLARVMKRPFWLPAPPFALRLLLGEMSTLVVDGQYMIPARLQELGYRFRFESAEDALQDLLKVK
jgi:uncharacterized protein (TIGR01777 family)